MQAFQIYYKDPSIVAIEKPSGYQVHPPENPMHSIRMDRTVIAILSKQLQTKVYPVHRLDRATSGVMIFALNPQSASKLCQQFSSQTINKTYLAVIRGWMTEPKIIRHSIREESLRSTYVKDAITEIDPLFHFELPYPNRRHITSRFSVIRANPKTGRHHQIRQHLKHLRHPIIGDNVYGDGTQNKIFREYLKTPFLCLRATAISFDHPETNRRMTVCSLWNGKWHRFFDQIGWCPWDLQINISIDKTIE